MHEFQVLLEDVSNAEVFNLNIVIDAMVRTLTPQAGLLDAAKRHMLGRENADIDADHAVFECFADAEDASDIAAVEVAGQAKLGVVGGKDYFLLGLELEHRRERAKGLLLGAQHVGGGISNDSGLKKQAR